MAVNLQLATLGRTHSVTKRESRILDERRSAWRIQRAPGVAQSEVYTDTAKSAVFRSRTKSVVPSLSHSCRHIHTPRLNLNLNKVDLAINQFKGAVGRICLLQALAI